VDGCIGKGRSLQGRPKEKTRFTNPHTSDTPEHKGVTRRSPEKRTVNLPSNAQEL